MHHADDMKPCRLIRPQGLPINRKLVYDPHGPSTSPAWESGGKGKNFGGIVRMFLWIY